MNAMMLAQTMFHILQQGLEEGAPSFETLNQVIKNISKDIQHKAQTQTCKELKAKTRKMKADAKTTRKSLVKKRDIVIKSSSSYDSEVSLPPLKEEIYSMLVVAPKNDQWLVHFMKAKRDVPNSTMSFSNFTPFPYNPDKIFLIFQVA
jgi:hypothetical protein